MLAVWIKELGHFFKTPLGYVYLSVSLFISGLLFTLMNLAAMSTDFASVLQLLQILLIFTVPLLTMPLFSQERKHGTDHLLLTSGVPLWQVVLGKIEAAVFLLLLTIVAMIPYLIVIEMHGSVDWLRVVSSLLGYFLLGLLYICIGTFISCLTDNQMLAAICAFAALFALWLLQIIAEIVPADASFGMWMAIFFCGALVWFFYHQTQDRRVGVASALVLLFAVGLLILFDKDFFGTWLGKTLLWLSVPRRYSSFLMGVISWGDVAFFVGLSSLFAYFSVWKLEKRRWSED